MTMDRDVKHNALYSYTGTFKDFCRKTCKDKNPKDLQKLKRHREVCDLTSCPIDGAYLVLSKIGSIVILFHSPPGCSMGLWILWGGAYSLKSVVGSKKESECITLCTNMNEEDVVFGGEQKLAKALEDIHRRFNPQYVCVLSSCCPGIIGDSIDTVVASAREKLGMKIGWLDSSGFKSRFWPNGYDLANQFIVDEIMEPADQVEPDVINLIPYGNAASVDEKECSRLLAELGLRVQTPLSVPYTTLEKIREAPRAKATTMMCLTFGWNFSQAMQKRFGTGIVPESHPIGSHFTAKWIRSVAAEYGKEKEAEALIERESAAIREDLEQLREDLKGKTIAISAGHDKLPSLLAMAAELGLRTVYAGLITYDDLVNGKLEEVAEIYDYDFESVLFPQTYEEIPTIKRLNPDVFIGPAGLTPKNVMMGVCSVSTHFNDFIGPYFGFRGLITFGREILNSIRDPMPRYAPMDFLIQGRERVCGESWFNMTTGRKPHE